MIIVGAKGFAKEVLHALSNQEENLEGLCFYDDVSLPKVDCLYDRFEVIHDEHELKEHFRFDSRFVVGVGGTNLRKTLVDRMLELGGVPYSVMSISSSIGLFGTTLGKGAVVLGGSSITNDVTVGDYAIINKSVILAHDVEVGSYCEFSPGAKILGRAKVGSHVSVGAGAIVLPGVCIGDECTVGAGSVVTKSVDAGNVVFGVPARVR